MPSLIKKKMKVGVFPLSEKSWIDVGQWKDFLKVSDEPIVDAKKLLALTDYQFELG